MSVDARMQYNILNRKKNLFNTKDTKELLMKLKQTILNCVAENDWKGYDSEVVGVGKDVLLAINTLRSGLIYIKVKRIEVDGQNVLLLTSEGYTSAIESAFTIFIEETRKLKTFKKIYYYDKNQESLVCVE